MRKRKDILNELVSILASDEKYLRDLPNLRSNQCLNCRNYGKDLGSTNSVCLECEGRISAEDKSRFEDLTKVTRFEAYPSVEFSSELEIRGLSPKLVESYYKVFGLQKNAISSRYDLTVNQRARHLNIVFHEKRELFDQLLQNLLTARESQQYHLGVASSEADLYLQRNHDFAFKDLKDAFAILNDFEFQPDVSFKQLKEKISADLWHKRLGDLEHNVLNGKEIIKLAKDFNIFEEKLLESRRFSYWDVLYGLYIINFFHLESRKLLLKVPRIEDTFQIDLSSNNSEEQETVLRSYRTLAQVKFDFLLFVRHNLDEHQIESATLAAQHFHRQFASREYLSSLDGNMYSAWLVDVCDQHGITVNSFVLRFFLIIRRNVDPDSKHRLTTWLFYLLIKRRPGLWVDIVLSIDDPDFGDVYSIAVPPKPKDDIPVDDGRYNWVFGPKPVSSMARGRKRGY